MTDAKPLRRKLNGLPLLGEVKPLAKGRASDKLFCSSLKSL
jgi:hypothetical protein